MGLDLIGLMEGALLVWSELAKGLCTGVLGRTVELSSCGIWVTTEALSISNRIKFIRQSLTQEQTLRVLTYPITIPPYGSAIWMGAVTTSYEWKLLNRAHYRAFRIVTRDYRVELSRKDLDSICKRATPRQWSYYSVASTVISIVQNQGPSLLYDLLKTNCTNNRRGGIASFFDMSRRKIGRQSLHNQVSETFKQVQFAWLGLEMSKATI
jgi:hypothetical protein